MIYVFSDLFFITILTYYQLIETKRELIDIFLSTQSKKREVIAFLEDLKELLCKGTNEISIRMI